MTDQKDIYRAAQIMINQHGKMAERMALEKMRKFADEEDEVAASAWLTIAKTVQELQELTTSGTIH